MVPRQSKRRPVRETGNLSPRGHARQRLRKNDETGLPPRLQGHSHRLGRRRQIRRVVANGRRPSLVHPIRLIQHQGPTPLHPPRPQAATSRRGQGAIQVTDLTKEIRFLALPEMTFSRLIAMGTQGDLENLSKAYDALQGHAGKDAHDVTAETLLSELMEQSQTNRKLMPTWDSPAPLPTVTPDPESGPLSQDPPTTSPNPTPREAPSHPGPWSVTGESSSFDTHPSTATIHPLSAASLELGRSLKEQGVPPSAILDAIVWRYLLRPFHPLTVWAGQVCHGGGRVQSGWGHVCRGRKDYRVHPTGQFVSHTILFDTNAPTVVSKGITRCWTTHPPVWWVARQRLEKSHSRIDQQPPCLGHPRHAGPIETIGIITSHRYKNTRIR